MDFYDFAMTVKLMHTLTTLFILSTATAAVGIVVMVVVIELLHLRDIFDGLTHICDLFQLGDAVNELKFILRITCKM